MTKQYQTHINVCSPSRNGSAVFSSIFPHELDGELVSVEVTKKNKSSSKWLWRHKMKVSQSSGFISVVSSASCLYISMYMFAVRCRGKRLHCHSAGNICLHTQIMLSACWLLPSSCTARWSALKESLLPVNHHLPTFIVNRFRSLIFHCVSNIQPPLIIEPTFKPESWHCVTVFDNGIFQWLVYSYMHLPYSGKLLQGKKLADLHNQTTCCTTLFRCSGLFTGCHCQP